LTVLHMVVRQLRSLRTPELLSYITQFLPDVQLPVYKKGGFGRKFVTTISFK